MTYTRTMNLDCLLRNSPDKAWQAALKNMPLNGEWLKKEMENMTEKVYKIPPYGSRSGATGGIPSEYRNSSFQLLAGPLDETLRSFLSNCFEKSIGLPVTVSRFGLSNEPCGMAISRYNLTPELIRHFLGVFYDKKKWEKQTGQKFFPFENRDHLVHSLLVAILGNLILGVKVEPEDIEGVLEELQISNSEADVLGPIDNLFNLMSITYHKKFGLSPVNADNWLKKAWPAIAFWHDAGYDPATWFLLTAREFAHCRSLDHINENLGIEMKNIFKFLYSNVTNETWFNKNDLYKKLKLYSSNQLSDQSAPNDAYHLIWFIEGCHLQNPKSRYWGRFHALLSAYEFYKHYKWNGFTDPEIKHLTVAIAEHHEQKMNPDQTRADMVKEFVRNPIGLLLCFADALATTQRVKLDWYEEAFYQGMSGRKGKLSFTMDLNTDPIYIKNHTTSRPEFFHGNRYEEQEEAKKVLWGSILKKKGLETQKNDCSFRKFGRNFDKI